VRSLVAPASQDKREPLSPQEERVLALVAEGKTNKEIAVALTLSEKTVGHYLENIFQKLQVNRRAQAAVYFTQQRPKP
jgi:two-component system, NarL family, response regulator DevR